MKETWLVLLADGTRLDISADWCAVEYGSLVFYERVEQTDNNRFVEDILLQALPSGVWMSVTLRAKKETE